MGRQTEKGKGGRLRGVIYFSVNLLLVLVIAATAGECWDAWNVLKADGVAESDYLKLKTAVFNAVSKRPAPERFMMLNRVGPAAYTKPLSQGDLSAGVRGSAFHQTRRRRNRPPVTVTRIDVQHNLGMRIYRYYEVNGRVYEQVILREDRESLSPFRKFYQDLHG